LRHKSNVIYLMKLLNIGNITKAPRSRWRTDVTSQFVRAPKTKPAIYLGLVTCAVIVLASCSTVPPTEESATKSGFPRQASWAGTYVFSSVGTTTTANTTPVVDYTLRISDKPSMTTLETKGYQTDRTLVCDVHAIDNLAEIRFVSFAGGALTNEFGIEEYKPGETLFTLHRELKDGRYLLKTTFIKMNPDGEKVQDGEYFKLQIPGRKAP
jgi:hypothetical protein